MLSIDYIIGLLDWGRSLEEQAQGIELAKGVRCIKAFILPCSKSAWDNCAKVISTKTDEELEPYLPELFKWLQDMNWPGARCILDRLNGFQNSKAFNLCLGASMQRAEALHDDIWLETLQEVKPLQADIDYVMDLLDENNQPEMQELGINLAKEIKHLTAFLRPGKELDNKSAWRNCARILSDRSDQELTPYLYELMDWLEDMEWQGADLICDRLNRFQKSEMFCYCLKESMETARIMGKSAWLNNLRKINAVE